MISILSAEVHFFVFLVIFMDGFSDPFLNKQSLNELSSAIGGTYFNHVRTYVIILSLHIGIFVGCLPYFDIRLLEVSQFIFVLIISFIQEV